MSSRFRTALSALLFLALVVPASAANTGSVEGTITWQYNDYVGTKGDVGAKVVLFPEHLAHKLNGRNPKDAEIISSLALGIVTPDVERLGIRGGEADGFGKAEVDDVPAGYYVVLIVSSKTTRDFEKPVSDADLEMLRSYFATDASFGRLKASPLLKLKKFWTETVEVHSGSTAHFSHDFGNTFI